MPNSINQRGEFLRFALPMWKQRHLHALLARYLLACAEVTNENQGYVTPEVPKNVANFRRSVCYFRVLYLHTWKLVEATKTVVLPHKKASVILMTQVKAVIL